jgi:hypothetical protein
LIPNGERMPAEQHDDDLKRIWRAYAAGRLSDDEAQAAAQAAYARRSCQQGKDTAAPPKPPTGRRRASCRVREKVFGLGRPRALDRNAKVRIMHWARCLARRTEAGKAYGVITAKALAVLEALLWAFHNAKNGLCFPSYERIAEAAHCARSTVAEAIKALEDAGVLSWVNRVKRIRERCADLLGADGGRWRVIRTSNAYQFTEPGAAYRSSKSENPTGTPNQDFPPLSLPPSQPSARAQRAFKGDKSQNLYHSGRPPVDVASH